MNSVQRLIKKLTIILIVFGFIGLAVFLIFKPKTDPCFNKKQDNGEVGVDCGGFCAAKCPLTPKPSDGSDIEINWVKFVEDGRGNYDLVANLSNENQKYGIVNADYTFTYYDDKGAVIGKKEGQTSIAPKGNTMDLSSQYVVEDNVKSEVVPARVDFSLGNMEWGQIENSLDVDSLSENIVKVNQANFKFDKDINAYIVTGVTKNESKYDFVHVDIYAIVFGKDGNVLAVGKTNQLTVAAGDGWGFTIVWPNLKVDQSAVDHVNYRTSTNVFDKNNFMKEYRVN